MKTIGYLILAILLLGGGYFLIYHGAPAKKATEKTVKGSAPSSAAKMPKVREVKPQGAALWEPPPRGQGAPDLAEPPAPLPSSPNADQLRQSGLKKDQARTLSKLMSREQQILPDPPPFPTYLDMNPAERRDALRKGITAALAKSKAKISPEVLNQLTQGAFQNTEAGANQLNEMYINEYTK